MEPLNYFHRAQLAAQAGDGGLSITVWPLIFRSSTYAAGQVQLPPAADELYIAEVAGPPTTEPWMAGIFLFRGSAAEPTRARYEARQLAREIKTVHYAWLYRGCLEGPNGWEQITVTPGRWLQHFACAAGIQTNRWYTTSTR